MVRHTSFAARLALFLMVAIAGGACQSSTSSNAPASSGAPPAIAARAPSAPPANAPSDQDLYLELAGFSIVGFNGSGEPTCEYYRADGALMTSAGSRQAEGTWAVNGQQACLQLGGAPICKIYSFAPDGSVQYWFTADNTSTIGEVVAGNRCR
ncbi:MAG: hypothetical protein H6842_15130 [Rhodospirillaceae bacterium]|nr:hypothetical protein [Rhodospirillaceae bacterium]